MKRVLKASGRLIFVEHGRAPDLTVEAWQNRFTPVWKHIGGGCHLNRKIDELITAAGFQIIELKTWLPSWTASDDVHISGICAACAR